MTDRPAAGKNRAVRNFLMQLPVGGQFARDGAVVASQKGNVTTGTSRITGHFYSALAALRLDRPWRASASATWRQAQGASAIRAVKSDVSVCARMIEWKPFDSYRTGGEGLACEGQ